MLLALNVSIEFTLIDSLCLINSPLAIFIRGLYEAFSRNPSNTDLRILIHSYIDVQVRFLEFQSCRVNLCAWNISTMHFLT